jgi:hypothetical protein
VNNQGSALRTRLKNADKKQSSRLVFSSGFLRQVRSST